MSTVRIFHAIAASLAISATALAPSAFAQVAGLLRSPLEVGDFGPPQDVQKPEDGEAQVLKVIEVFTRSLAADPDDIDLHVVLGQAHIRYGDILREQGDEKKAIFEYRAALKAVDLAVDKRGASKVEVNQIESTIRDLKKTAKESLKELTKASSSQPGNP